METRKILEALTQTLVEEWRQDSISNLELAINHLQIAHRKALQASAGWEYKDAGTVEEILQMLVSIAENTTLPYNN
ncbi:hypothetical protein CAL7716_107550 (plasmid) [Calothrix sp. PCC 7716]|nr:hypothetical protein CAL7716_107550 [Calothrix sp. PCC 7716]